MQGGKLRHQINIERAAYNRSSSGERIATWGIWNTRYSEIKPVTGKLAEFAKTIGATVSHRIQMRWIDGLLPTDRIAYGSRIFTIDAIINVEERRREIHVYATEDLTRSQPAAAVVGYDTLSEDTYDTLQE